MKAAAMLLLAVAAMAADPFTPGTYDIQTITGKVTGDNETAWDYRVIAPMADVHSPVMLFVTGFGGLTPSDAYSDIAHRLAKKGITFIGMFRLASPAPKKDGKSLINAIPWLRKNVQIETATMDWDTFMVSGHSAGNHVWCDYLTYDCSVEVKGVVMIDPVDGFDPMGKLNDFCTSTTEKLPFSAPALLISTGLDPVVPPNGTLPCAPAALSNLRYYNAWNGPIWMVNATEYAHLDCGDLSLEILLHGLCPTDNAPKAPYKEEIAGLISAFVQVIQGNTDAASALTDTSAMPVNTISTYTLNGNAAPFTGGCHAV